MTDDKQPLQINLSGLRERVAHLTYMKTIEAETAKLEEEQRFLKTTAREKEKEYNEKVSNLIMGTGNVPTIVGQTQEANGSMCYDFVSFKDIHTKDPIEYIDPKKVDYIVHNPDKENSKLKEDMPFSFMDIKEGEVKKGKEWYLRRDPKLPEGIAELMARYNWGDLKNMPNKKQYKNAQKKLQKKGKDILGDGKLCAKKGCFVVSFD